MVMKVELGQEGGEALMKMEGEVSLLPPCFAPMGLGNVNHPPVFHCGLRLLYFY